MKSKVSLFVVFAVLVMVLAIGCQSPVDSNASAGGMSKSSDTLELTGEIPSFATTGKPVGWGKDVTGGSGTSVTVDTFSELEDALDDESKKIIYIDGTIKMSDRITIQDRDDFSIIGKNNARLVSTDTSKSDSGIFYIKRVTNMIIQNITFEGPGAYDTDGYDSLCIDNCQYVWVDHCDFQDGMDGNFDIKNMSNYVTVSWCIFQYKKAPIPGGSGGSDDHRYSNLIGSSDSATGDDGKLKVTFYYCRWGQGVRERMPRVRYGQIHILNCLYDSEVSNYCIRAAYKANILVEGCYFDDQDIPIDLYSGYSAVKASNNYGYDNMSAGSSIFSPGYSYSVDSASGIASTIKSNAGATLDGSISSSSSSSSSSTTNSTSSSSSSSSNSGNVDGKLVLNASNGSYSGGSASGTSVLLDGKEGSYIEWTFSMSQSDDPTVAWNYSCDDKVKFNIIVNGSTITSKSFDASKTETTKGIDFSSGSVTVRLEVKEDADGPITINSMTVKSEYAN